MLKYRWKVQPAPTGRYRAFERRGWPEVKAGDEVTIAYISCPDDYSPHRMKHGLHAPLKLYIRCPKEATEESPCPWVFRKLKGEFVMLAEAKKAFAEFVEQHPDHNFVLGE